MKKALLAAALMTLGASAAQAQSSVTLYGRLDNGLEYINGLSNASGGSSSRMRAESGDWGTSLFGFKGAEDIGGGTKIIFKLESGINTSNGTAGGPNGQLFQRYAYVGAQNDTYGTLTAGRMLWIVNGDWDFDPFGQSNWSSASLVRGRNWLQTSNNIAYQSPNFAGFDVQGMYSNGNTTTFNAGRGMGLQVTYTSPLFQVRGIYDELRDANGGFSDVFNTSREYFAGVNVFLGKFKLQAVYQASHASSAGLAANTDSTSTQTEWGGLTYQLTPAAAVIAAVYHVNANNGGGNATIYTVGGSYNLSKRTLLDIQIATVHNSSSANFGLEANSATTAAQVGSNDNPVAGHSQSGVYAGIQHVF